MQNPIVFDRGSMSNFILLRFIVSCKKFFSKPKAHIIGVRGCKLFMYQQTNCSAKEYTSIFILPIWKLIAPCSRNAIRTLYEIRQEETIYMIRSGEESSTVQMLGHWAHAFENLIDAISLMEFDAPELALDIYNRESAAAVSDEMQTFMVSTAAVIRRMTSIGIRSRAASQQTLRELHCKIQLWHSVLLGLINTLDAE